jgi:hypothetical protein
VIGDEEAPLRENVITALLGALDEELAGLVTDIARVRDSVKLLVCRAVVACSCLYGLRQLLLAFSTWCSGS